jgi:1-acyl-sn-glycerol-3-phosphate acyltransferase
MAGFIPVDMADNGSGNDNEYDKSSFKVMLRSIKQAFQDGFDISILPEGQLNPTPEQGLKTIFPGAYTLAKLSRRPIQMVALHGTHRLWHADESIGMTVTGTDVKVRVYPPMGRKFESAQDFTQSFEAIVGTFGTTGQDLPSNQISQLLGLDNQTATTT